MTRGTFADISFETSAKEARSPSIDVVAKCLDVRPHSFRVGDSSRNAPVTLSYLPFAVSSLRKAAPFSQAGILLARCAWLMVTRQPNSFGRGWAELGQCIGNKNESRKDLVMKF